jgi:lipoprotein NlpI
MLRAIIRLGLALLLVTGAGLSVRADPAALVRAGAEALQQGQWDDAIRLLNQAIAAGGLSGSDRAVAHNRRGYAYFAKGQADRAMADYTEAVRLAPNDADAHSLRGWAHFTKGSMREAIADSTAAIRIDPSMVFAYRNRGRAQLYSGQPKAAADDFAAAVRLAPSDALGVIWLHVARARSGQNDLEEFRANTAKIDHREWPGTLLEVVTGASTPEHVGDIAMSATGAKTQSERVCDAQVYFGLLQLAAGDKAEARALFKAAAEDCPTGVAEATELAVANLELKGPGGAPARTARGPSGAEVAATHHERGQAYFDQGQVDRALAEYGSAIRLAPNDAQNYHLRGLAYFTKGAMNQTITDSTAAIRLDPSSAVSLRVRGLAQLYAGRPKPAVDDFAAAVRLAPSDALGVIWLHVARSRVGHEDAQELRTNVARVDRREWPGPVVEVLTGAMTVERVGDIAMAAEGEKTRRERVCDAQVYFGLLQLTAGDKGEARKLFNAAVADCPAGAAEAAELAVAKMELKRLGTPPATGAPRSRTPKPPPVAQESEPRSGGSR